MSLEEELREGAEHAHERGEKGIGLTMAIVAVLLAIATLMGHRTHTEEGLIQGKIVDEWNFYQAKHIRAHEYGAMAEIAALLPNGKELALKDYKKSLDEECGTPPEHGCNSPAKGSSILRPLLTLEATTGGNEDKKEQDKPVKEESPAKDDAVKEHGKEADAAKEQHENKSSNHRPGAVNIQESAKEMERERDLVERRANYYDGAELFLEISIVLCSIALLADAKLFWKLSFISTILGVGVALFGFLGVH